jgi:AcrR family transcriptional regulator
MTKALPTPQRPRLSDGFLRASVRNRVIAGTSEVIFEMGYDAGGVADIVRVCRVARKTFYDTFGGKEEAARALVTDLGLEFEGLSTHQALDILLIELAAAHHVRDSHHPQTPAAKLVEIAKSVICHLGNCELVKQPDLADPRQHRLPPGRNSIPPSFKRENQQTRLVTSFAAVVAETGFRKTTISSVCTRAGVSRRTFYEHFNGLTDLGLSMLRDAVVVDLPYRPQVDPTLTTVAIEVVAQCLTKGESPLAKEALAALPKLAKAIA